MNRNVWLAVLTGISLTACGGGSQPEASEPAPPEESAEVPAEPEPAPEPAPEPEPDPAQVKAELLAQEKAAFELAEPIFKKHCAKCHSKGKKAKKKTLKHFDMTNYPFGGEHADEITKEIREVLAIGGGKATMPMDKPGAVEGDELSLIASWADAFDKAEAGGAHEKDASGEPEAASEDKD
jgi:hypothetical protein